MSQRDGSFLIESMLRSKPSLKGKNAKQQTKNAANAIAILRETDGIGTPYTNAVSDSTELGILMYAQFQSATSLNLTAYLREALRSNT